MYFSLFSICLFLPRSYAMRAKKIIKTKKKKNKQKSKITAKSIEKFRVTIASEKFMESETYLMI